MIKIQCNNEYCGKIHSFSDADASFDCVGSEERQMGVEKNSKGKYSLTVFVKMKFLRLLISENILWDASILQMRAVMVGTLSSLLRLDDTCRINFERESPITCYWNQINNTG